MTRHIPRTRHFKEITMMDTLRFRCPRPTRVIRAHATLGAFALALLWAGSKADAQDAKSAIPACTAASCPATYMQLAVNDIQYAPGLFKLQARISQAKIPVGDAVFDSITVNLVRPGATQNRVACTETLPGVRVRNSVLNLDIGRQMTSCQLDQVIAQEQDLAFEICINSPDNCLKPIPLGSTPYALKSNYAVLAQKAHSANQAVQAHYAHRVTADTELFVGERTHEDGYLDFATPDGNTTLSTTGWERISSALKADMRSVYGAEPESRSAAPVGGFIQWTPVSSAENAGNNSQASLGTLHLVAKDEATADKVLKPLARMMIHADQTFATGELHVLPTNDDAYSLRSTAQGTAVVAGGILAGTKQEITSTGFHVQRGNEEVSLSQAGVFLRTATAEVKAAGDTAGMKTSTTSVQMQEGAIDIAAGVAQGPYTPAKARFGAGSINLDSGWWSKFALSEDAKLDTRLFTVNSWGANLSMTSVSAELRAGNARVTLSRSADSQFSIGNAGIGLQGSTATVYGGTGAMSVSNNSISLRVGAVDSPRVMITPSSVSLGGRCLADVNPECSGFSGDNITSLAGSKVTGDLTNATIAGSKVNGELTNATIAGSKVNGQLSNATIDGSRVSGHLSNATIDGPKVAGQLTNATIAGTKIEGRIKSENLPENPSVSGSLSYTGQLSKLSVAEQGSAYIRAADLRLGHSSRRGTTPKGKPEPTGRALVDDETNSLVLNYDKDWDRARVDSPLEVRGTLKVTTGTAELPASSIDIHELDLEHVTVAVGGAELSSKGGVVVRNALHCSHIYDRPAATATLCETVYDQNSGWRLNSLVESSTCLFTCSGDGMTFRWGTGGAYATPRPVDHGL